MQPRDIYIQLTDPNGIHKQVVNHHRVWDAERFVAAQKKQYEQAKNEEDRRLVSVVSKPH